MTTEEYDGTIKRKRKPRWINGIWMGFFHFNSMNILDKTIAWNKNVALLCKLDNLALRNAADT